MAKDPYFDNVVLLMHCDDFTDVKGATATLVNSPTIDTTEKKFGSGCLRLAAGSYITFPDSDDWDFNAGEFTIEFWAKAYNYTTDYNLITHGTSTSTGGLYWYVTTNTLAKPYFGFASNSANVYTTVASDAIASGWRWFAFQRNADGYLSVFSNNGWYNTSGVFQTLGPGNTAPLQIGSADASVYLDEIRITKGVARYSINSLPDAPSEPFPDRSYDILEDSIIEAGYAGGYVGTGDFSFLAASEALSLAETTSIGWIRAIEDYFSIHEPPLVTTIGRAASVAESLTASETTGVSLASIIADYANLADTVGIKATYAQALAELALCRDSTSLARPTTLQDSVTVTWALGVVQGAYLAERLGLSEALNFPIKYGLSLAETLRIYDSLAKFLHFDLAETITATDTMAGLARHMIAVSEPLALTESVSQHFILSVEAHDDAIFDDSFSLKMLYRPEIREQINIAALYVSPNGGVTTWAVNTRTGAVTEYSNYDFNSFAQSGRRYLGASVDGLYVLDGDDDAGQPTIAHLRSGYAQFGGSRYTSFKAAYLGLRGDGSVFLKLDTGDGKSYTYKAVVQDQQSTKVRFGKGLRARYFAYELISEGQDFDLDTIEFVPVVAQRRV